MFESDSECSHFVQRNFNFETFWYPNKWFSITTNDILFNYNSIDKFLVWNYFWIEKLIVFCALRWSYDNSKIPKRCFSMIYLWFSNTLFSAVTDLWLDFSLQCFNRFNDWLCSWLIIQKCQNANKNDAFANSETLFPITKGLIFPAPRWALYSFYFLKIIGLIKDHFLSYIGLFRILKSRRYFHLVLISVFEFVSQK